MFFKLLFSPMRFIDPKLQKIKFDGCTRCGAPFPANGIRTLCHNCIQLIPRTGPVCICDGPKCAAARCDILSRAFPSKPTQEINNEKTNFCFASFNCWLCTGRPNRCVCKHVSYIRFCWLYGDKTIFHQRPSFLYLL